MAAQTTPTKVKGILQTALKAPDIVPFVEDANLWVSEELTASSVSDARRELVARYLAAALITLRDKGMTSVTLDDVTEHYQVDPEVTDYLLRAAGMDPTGRVRSAFLASRDRVSGYGRVGTGFAE